MNNVRISGKVLAAYRKDDNVFVCRIACKHDHIIGIEQIRCESVFNTIMTDMRRIPHVDVMAGDDVLVTGHLKIDFKRSANGTEHQNLKIYADDIEVTKSCREYI